MAGAGPGGSEPLDPIGSGAAPVASNASPRAQRLLSYLQGMYGQKMLSGQMESDFVNIRWHWGAPTHGEGYDASQEQVDIDRVLTPGTAEHTSMLAGLERTAAELTKPRDADVPVLWTPFHELNGDWFWWGKGSPEQFIQLWRFMFDYLDQGKGLNNLIWVLVLGPAERRLVSWRRVRGIAPDPTATPAPPSLSCACAMPSAPSWARRCP